MLDRFESGPERNAPAMIARTDAPMADRRGRLLAVAIDLALNGCTNDTSDSGQPTGGTANVNGTWQVSEQYTDDVTSGSEWTVRVCR